MLQTRECLLIVLQLASTWALLSLARSVAQGYRITVLLFLRLARLCSQSNLHIRSHVKCAKRCQINGVIVESSTSTSKFFRLLTVGREEIPRSIASPASERKFHFVRIPL